MGTVWATLASRGQPAGFYKEEAVKLEKRRVCPWSLQVPAPHLFQT